MRGGGGTPATLSAAMHQMHTEAARYPKGHPDREWRLNAARRFAEMIEQTIPFEMKEAA